MERDNLKQLLALYGQYHNHKEQMAFSVFGLEGAFFVGLFLLGNWPPAVERMNPIGLACIFVVVWILFHLALRYQLRNRRLAAIMVASYVDSLAQTEDILYERSAHAFSGVSSIVGFIDTTLVPMRGAFREADVDMPSFADGTIIRPATLRSFQYHLARHKTESAVSWTKYALPIEWIASAGSILLLGIALYRVLGAVAS